VAGNDSTAKKTVMRLVEELGFDAVDAGSLQDSRRRQPGPPLYAKDLDADGVKRALREAKRERTGEWRA
jgi:predicted dinucleotide-binding enzyme